MKLSTTYRRILATCFLLLYFFIATPVQLWHHHTVAKEKFAITKITKADSNSQNEGCKICQHTYAVYIDDGIRCDINVVDLLSGNNSFFNTSFPSPCIDKASNKGPPQTWYC